MSQVDRSHRQQTVNFRRKLAQFLNANKRFHLFFCFDLTFGNGNLAFPTEI